MKEKPYICPICGGTGYVPNEFYNKTSSKWSTSSITPEFCRSCKGTGIVWGAPSVDTRIETLKEQNNTLMETYYKKIEIANTNSYLTEFIFEFNGIWYKVEWSKHKWSDPSKIYVL